VLAELKRTVDEHRPEDDPERPPAEHLEHLIMPDPAERVGTFGRGQEGLQVVVLTEDDPPLRKPVSHLIGIRDTEKAGVCWRGHIDAEPPEREPRKNLRRLQVLFIC
jgi:hypothetical protein